MICNVKGIVLSVRVVKPQNGNKNAEPYQEIGLAQSTGEQGGFQKVKDYNLNKRYNVGGQFSETCNVNHWQMNNRAGLSCTVTEGSLIYLNQDSTSELEEAFE